MSWIHVDFSLVRYSPIEGTHYFYDPSYPAAIQFLLSGRWEPWDVGWVKHKAQDPDLRRIAEDAETRLTHDRGSGYTPWPEPPPPGPPHLPEPNDYPLLPVEESPLPSPLTDRPSHSPQYGHHPDDNPTSPQRPSHGASAQPPRAGPHAPPYEIHSVTSQPLQTTCATSPTTQPPAHPPEGPSAPRIYGAQQQPWSASPQLPVPAPAPAPAPPSPAILTRNRETKILLSLDGDGVRGLSSILLVESLINAICTKLAQPVSPHMIFDLMGGTSTGGLIAIMLGRLRMPAHNTREAYKLLSRQVFSNKRDFFVSLDPYVPLPNYDGQALENEIKNVVQQETGNEDELLFDMRDNSADVFVVSTNIDIGTNKAALMRSYQTRRITGPEIDANMTIVQAMRATSAAPRYMLPRDGFNRRPVIEPGLVDHGTAKNNPIRDILYECRKLYRYANDMMVIVSIGTGAGLDRSREIAEMAKSVEDRSAEARIWGDKFEGDHRALMERGWMKYFRFNVPDLDSVPLEEWCHEDVIREKTLAYLATPAVGQSFYACVDAIAAVLIGGQHAR